MGRELFDYAFKEYARRWAFKHPTPADLFRTLEDASGEDLDWFWKGWFYSTDVTDMSIDAVKYFKMDPKNNISAQRDTVILRRVDRPLGSSFQDVSKIRNREDKNLQFQTDADTSLRDFYWKYARGLEVYDTTRYAVPRSGFIEPVSDDSRQKISDKHFYELAFSNKGGLVMPIIVEFTFKDGTKEVDRIPAQIWRYNENSVTKIFMKDKEVASIKLDPMRETADINESNNTWGNIPAPSKFQVYKLKQQGARGQSSGFNPMQKAKEKQKGF